MIEFQGKPLTGSSEATLVKAWARSEAAVKFADCKEKDLDFAAACVAFTSDYVKSMPIGCNFYDKEVLHEKIAQAIREEVVPQFYSG